MVDDSQTDKLVSLSNSEELISFLKKNAEGAKTALNFVGSGASYPYGYQPEVTWQAVSLNKMKNVVDYPFRDMTITVEAGITIAELRQILAEHHQRLPIDVPFPEETTLGGAISANLYGSRGYQLGTWRDFVIGMSAVDGQGRRFKSGGRVVKNVAGYDLAKLMIGSHGTLGAISQVTLQVRPIPEQSRFLWLTYPDFQATEKALAQLISTDTLPVVIDVLNSVTSKEISAASKLEIQNEGVSLLIGYEGNPKELDWQLETAKSELQVTAPASTQEVAGDLLWQPLTEIVRSRDSKAVLEINAKPSLTMQVCEQLEAAGVLLQCHGKQGMIRVTGASEVLESLCLKLRSQLKPEDGAVVLRKPGGRSREEFDLFDWNPLLESYMKQVKQKLDPHNLLAPGKLF